MAENEGFRGIIADGLESLTLVLKPTPMCDRGVRFCKADNIQVARLSWPRNLAAWLYVPAGILIILLACFAVNSLIGLSSVGFPASVACLIVLFFALIICDMIVGDRKTRALVNIIDVPVCVIS